MIDTIKMFPEKWSNFLTNFVSNFPEYFLEKTHGNPAATGGNSSRFIVRANRNWHSLEVLQSVLLQLKATVQKTLSCFT